MIYFSREGKQVKIVIDTKINTAEPSQFQSCIWDCEDEITAYLVYNHLQQTLWKTIEKTRKVEYERGWRHAKAKQKKEQYFHCRLEK